MGLWSKPLGNAEMQQPGASDFADSVWDQQDWFGLTKQVSREFGRYQAETGLLPGADPTLPGGGGPAEPRLDPDALNQQYGIDGHLKFDSPLPASVAQTMNQAKRDELMRQDAARRSDAGTLATMGAGFAAGMLDPLNVAASFMPFVGEGRVAGALGLDVAGGLVARVAARAATGAVNGAAAQVPLVGLRYGLSQQEQADYGAQDALADILMGGVLGGGMHTLTGGIGDVVGRSFQASPAARLIDDDPDIRMDTARAAVAQMVQDQPVDVAPLVDLATGQDGAAEVKAAMSGGSVIRRGGAYTPQSLLEFLSQRGGVADVGGDMTALGAREWHLEKPFRRKLVADYEAPDDAGSALPGMGATEGPATIKNGPDEMAYQAWEAGYLHGAERPSPNDLFDAVRQELHGKPVYTLDDQAVMAERAAADEKLKNDDYVMGLREDLRDTLDEHGLSLSPAETDHATRLMAEGRQTEEAIREAMQSSMGAFLEEMHGAADDMQPALRRAHGEADPAFTQTDQRATEVAAVQTTPTEIPQHVTDQTSELEDFFSRARDAGALDPAHEAELERIKEDDQQSQGWLKTITRAAACLMRGLA